MLVLVRMGHTHQGAFTLTKVVRMRYLHLHPNLHPYRKLTSNLKIIRRI